MKKKSVTVFCSARNAIAGHHLKCAHDLGLAIARDNKTLIYGGGANGMMGQVARACFEEGGEVIGVIPKFLTEWEGNDNTIITRTIITETMNERKRILSLLTDGFIIMAGGIGTLEEFAEVLALKNLHRHELPIIILDPDNYWHKLLSFFEDMVAQQFCNPDLLTDFVITNDPQKALSYI